MITHSFYFIPRGKTIKAITAYMEYMMDKKATRKLTILYNKDLKPENQEATATETRDQQRYGPGSGVGA